jgi:hypothetical protein
MTDQDEIIIEAVAYYDEKFPDLASGVMFFKGLRITREQFEKIGYGMIGPEKTACPASQQVGIRPMLIWINYEMVLE